MSESKKQIAVYKIDFFHFLPFPFFSAGFKLFWDVGNIANTYQGMICKNNCFALVLKILKSTSEMNNTFNPEII